MSSSIDPCNQYHPKKGRKTHFSEWLLFLLNNNRTKNKYKTTPLNIHCFWKKSLPYSWFCVCQQDPACPVWIQKSIYQTGDRSTSPWFEWDHLGLHTQWYSHSLQGSRTNDTLAKDLHSKGSHIWCPWLQRSLEMGHLSHLLHFWTIVVCNYPIVWKEGVWLQVCPSKLE